MTGSQSRTLHVVMSMDCVPPRAAPGIAGPQGWEAARRSMASFASVLKEEGLLGTFFVAPEALKRLRDTLTDLESEDMELGLLCHPQISNYKTYLGAYDYELHREIIHLGQEIWSDKMGEAARSFRAGFFSANDYTYQIICMEGFRQSSVSLPGRMDAEQYSMWNKTFPFPHHTDPLDRRNEGSMEVYEVPVTSDFEAEDTGSDETFTPPHLRLESPGISDYAEDLIKKHLDHMEAESRDVRTITFVTRNSVGWGRDDDPHVERLQTLMKRVRRLAESKGLEVVPQTLASLHEEADRVWKEKRGQTAE